MATLTSLILSTLLYHPLFEQTSCYTPLHSPPPHHSFKKKTKYHLPPYSRKKNPLQFIPKQKKREEKIPQKYSNEGKWANYYLFPLPQPSLEEKITAVPYHSLDYYPDA